MTAPLVERSHYGTPPGDDDPRAEAARRHLRAELAAFLPRVPICTSDPDAWFIGGTDAHHGSAGRIAAAVKACGPCPLRGPCSDAGQFERHGTWGGTSRERAWTHPERGGKPTADPQEVRRPRSVPSRPRVRVRRRPPGQPLPVECPVCGVPAGGVCVTYDQRNAEKPHHSRRRAAAHPTRPAPVCRRRLGRSALPVACPTCHVGPGDMCTTGSGKPAHENHDSRKRAAVEARCVHYE